MKKLIFGVILFAGSSFALANDIEIEKNIEQPEALKGNCYVQVVVNFQTPCGEYVYSQASPKYSVNCGSGQTEGTTSTYYETRQIDGWNMGSGPNPATSCVD